MISPRIGPPVIKTEVHFVKTVVGDRKYPILFLESDYRGRKSYLKVTRMFAKALLENKVSLQNFVDACATNDWTHMGIPVVDLNNTDPTAHLYSGPTTYGKEDAADVKKSTTSIPLEDMQPDVTDDKITFK